MCEPLSSGSCNATNNWDFCSQADFECSILNATDVENVTLSLDPTAVPATETNYYCQVFDLPNATDYHIIAAEPALNNAEVIHHMLLFGCGADREYTILHIFFGMFYQFLCVPHSRSSTQSWGSVLPSIVEARDQNFSGLPPSLFE